MSRSEVPVKVKMVVGFLCLAVLGCGGGGDERAAPAGESGVANVDLQQIAADKLDAACSSDAAGAECRKLLGNLVEKDDSRILDAVERWLGPACIATVDEACLRAARTLVAKGRDQAVEQLFAAGNEATSAVCSSLDRKTVSVLDGHWCEQYPTPEACSRLVECRVASGDQEMVVRQRQLEMRRVVAEVVKTRGASAGKELWKKAPKGEEGIRLLLEVASDGPGITLRERSLILGAVEAAGVSAYPALVSVIERSGIEASVLAAKVGWDEAAYEEEDDRPNEEPQRTVTLDESVDYIGKNLTVFLRDGTKREGVLKRIEGDLLHLEVSIGGGSITMKVRQSEVERIAF